MSFKKIISQEGNELLLHETHKIFSIPIFIEFNFDEAIPISYRDLLMIANYKFIRIII